MAERRTASGGKQPMATDYGGDGPSGYGRSNAADVPPSYWKPDERWDRLQAGGCMSELAARLGPAPVSLQWPGCTAEEAVSAIARDGFVILRNAVPDTCCDDVLRQLQPHIDSTMYGTDDGLGKTTRRTGAVVARSSASWQMATHPLVSEVCDAVLGRQVIGLDLRAMQEMLVRADREPFEQHPWQLELSQMITIEPPTAAQPLHRDDGKFVFDFRGMLDTQVGCIWALEDFNEEIGATRVVPGSHLWGKYRVAQRGEDLPAVMPKGSVVL